MDYLAVRPRVYRYLALRFCPGDARCGPKSAALIGPLVGFASGFPSNFAMAVWAPLSRHFPLWWMLELWVGAILAALVAGWLYQDPKTA
jgi:hypothetical protein